MVMVEPPTHMRSPAIRELPPASLSRSGRIIAIAGFAWVCMDSLMTYLMRVQIGQGLPVNWVLPAFLLVLLMAGGLRAVVLSPAVLLSLVLTNAGFLLGVAFVLDIQEYRVVEILGALCAFLAGYACFRWNHNEDTFAKIFLLVGGLYVVVSTIALLGLAQKYFPTIEHAWAYRGEVVLRPEVMTDQNFQIFYLLPIILVLALPYQSVRFFLAVVLAVGALFVLAKLQTRSGTLVFIGAGLLSLLTTIWNRDIEWKKIVALAILSLASLLFGAGWAEREGALLFARFTDTDYQTAHGRLISLMYLFDIVYDPAWWVPQGNADFVALHGTVPHSNITAMFLEGGILGLYGWVTIFVLPLATLIRQFFRREMDALATMAMLGGISMIVVQLSLNVPFFKQPWLWAGAVLGTVYRVRAARVARDRATCNVGIASL